MVDRQGVAYWDGVAGNYLDSSNTIVSPFFNDESHSKFLRELRALRGERESGIVLEEGCGNGYLLPFLAEVSKSVYGIDISTQMLENTGRNTEGLDVLLRQADLADLPFDEGTFDEIFGVNSFLVAPRDERLAAFSETFRVLKEGGAFYGLFPSNESLMEQVYGLKEKLVAEGKEEDLALHEVYAAMVERRFDPIGGFVDSPNGETRLKLYNDFELRDILRKTGFKGTRIKKFKYPASVVKALGLINGDRDVFDWLVKAEKQ